MESHDGIITVIDGFAIYHYSREKAYNYINSVFLSYKFGGGTSEHMRGEMLRSASCLLADLKMGCPVLWDRNPPETGLAIKYVDTRAEWYAKHSIPGSNDLQEATYE